MSIEIPLTQGKVALVDDADAPALLAYKWCTFYRKKEDLFYAGRCISRFTSQTGKTQTILMHRFLCSLELYDRRQVDHVDGNGLNNTRINLRVCTKTQNNQNRRKRKDATSRFKGVFLAYGRWRAEMQANGLRLHLGTFSTEEDAALAYDRAALIHFGEFALTNAMLFPELLEKAVSS